MPIMTRQVITGRRINSSVMFTEVGEASSATLRAILSQVGHALVRGRRCGRLAPTLRTLRLLAASQAQFIHPAGFRRSLLQLRVLLDDVMQLNTRPKKPGRNFPAMTDHAERRVFLALYRDMGLLG